MDMITITEDRKIVCSVCKYEPFCQSIAPAREIIDIVEKHYWEKHTQLRDNER